MPFLLVLSILVLPLLSAAVLAIVALAISGQGGCLLKLVLLAMLTVPYFFGVSWALRWFLVDIRGKSEHVYISIH